MQRLLLMSVVVVFAATACAGGSGSATTDPGSQSPNPTSVSSPHASTTTTSTTTPKPDHATGSTEPEGSKPTSRPDTTRPTGSSPGTATTTHRSTNPTSPPGTVPRTATGPTGPTGPTIGPDTVKRCVNHVIGYRVDYPVSWWEQAEAGGPVGANGRCRDFAASRNSLAHPQGTDFYDIELRVYPDTSVDELMGDWFTGPNVTTTSGTIGGYDATIVAGTSPTGVRFQDWLFTVGDAAVDISVLPDKPDANVAIYVAHELADTLVMG